MPSVTRKLTTVERRKLRVRGKFSGTAKRPRVSIERSNMHTYLQAIDDVKGATIAGASDIKQTGTKTERAIKTAQALAESLKSQKVTAVVFDRGEFRYHGRVRAVAEALREAGITL